MDRIFFSRLYRQTCLTLIAVVVSIISTTANAETPSATPLSGSWKFYKGDADGAMATVFDDAKWESVTVPHTWNLDVLQKGTATYMGTAWYRKTLDLPADGKRRFLRFEAAGRIADVYFNGEHLGQHRGGYSAFCYEITKFIKPGENTLAVCVNNAADPTVAPTSYGLFTVWGGLYRPVSLLVKNPTCITPLDYASPGIYLLQKNVSADKADLQLTAKLSNARDQETARKLVFVIKDASGKIVKQVDRDVNLPAGATTAVSLDVTLDHPHLWNGREDPYLYSVTAELRDADKVVDSVTQPLGLRFYRVDPKDGFFLNGKYLNLHGVCRHQEWEQSGAALTDSQHQRDVELIYEMGANALRLAHYQQADTMYRLCDHNGIVVWAEIPCVQDWHEGPFQQNCEQQLTELIRQNFNHPAILFWGMFNESNVPASAVKTLNDLAKHEDPSRLTTAASDAKLSDQHRMTNLICWNRYPFWYAGAGSICKWRENLLAKEPELCVGLSEYGAGGCIDQHEANPQRPDSHKGTFFPEEYQSLVHEKIWRDIKDCRSLWSSFAWNMFDFSWPVVHRGNRPYMNHKGLVTDDRKTKKDAFFFYKSNWSKEPVLYITSRRYTNRDQSPTDVKVYANTGKVTLLVNGQSIGEQLPDDIHIAHWDEVPLKEGKNTIEVNAVRDGKTLTDQCEWNLNTQTQTPAAP